MEDLTSIRERIAGKRVVSVEADGDNLVLDDGTVLRLYMSDSDCCASAAGQWVLQPDALEAIITDVQIIPDEERSGDDGDGETNYATVAILHNQNPVALADCYANDGNGGYYFSVLSLSAATDGCFRATPTPSSMSSGKSARGHHELPDVRRPVSDDHDGHSDEPR